ncbi:MAG: hypothetical protein R3F46_13800 [bacterium]
MPGNHGQYQYDSLRDPDSQLAASFREQPLPRSLPLSLRTMAIDGGEISEQLRRRDIWFWDQAGLMQIMEHVDTADPYISGSEALYIERIRLYEKRGGKYMLSRPLATLENDGMLTTQRVRSAFQLDDPQVAASSIYHISFTTRPPRHQVEQIQQFQHSAYQAEHGVQQADSSGCATTWAVLRILFLIGFVLRWIHFCASGDG